MDYTTNNPKALNLLRLTSESKKTTLGFKCSPQLKLQLAQDAHQHNLTLSEYVESIVQSYKLSSTESYHEKHTESIVQPLRTKIDFYENVRLMELFDENQGKTFEFRNVNGENMKLTISSVEDVYTLLINTFKTVE